MGKRVQVKSKKYKVKSGNPNEEINSLPKGSALG
jgi:hypothetical protein